MGYERFERLVIGFGAAAVLGNVLISVASNGWTDWSSVLSGLMLLAVLVFAVHGGRTSGLVSASIASIVLVVVKMPALSAGSAIPWRELISVAVNVLAFGLVGIAGGEFCSRVKYVFARHDDSATIDDWSHVYNQRRAWELIEKARQRHSRYREPFTIVEIAGMAIALRGMRPARQRAHIRDVAGYLRGSIRLVDEVAHLDDGRFLVMLPHTERYGGKVVAERLLEGVRRTLGVDNVVSVRCLTSDDTLELSSLAAGISPPEENQERSGA